MLPSPTPCPNERPASRSQELSRTCCLMGTEVLISYFILSTILQSRFHCPTLEMRQPRQPTEVGVMRRESLPAQRPLSGRGLQHAASAPWAITMFMSHRALTTHPEESTWRSDTHLKFRVQPPLFREQSRTGPKEDSRSLMVSK